MLAHCVRGSVFVMLGKDGGPAHDSERGWERLGEAVHITVDQETERGRDFQRPDSIHLLLPARPYLL